MRYFIVTIAAFLLLAAPRAYAAPGDTGVQLQYAAGLDDMPLMPGLSPVPDEGVVFDQPDGRFVESLAVGHVGEGDVRDFYAAVLPQLGWQQGAQAPNGDYTRDGEKLNLEIERAGVQTRVRFTVSPTRAD